MFRPGGVTPDKLYLGETEVDKIYYGQNEIYTKPVPPPPPLSGSLSAAPLRNDGLARFNRLLTVTPSISGGDSTAITYSWTVTHVWGSSRGRATRSFAFTRLSRNRVSFTFYTSDSRGSGSLGSSYGNVLDGIDVTLRLTQSGVTTTLPILRIGYT